MFPLYPLAATDAMTITAEQDFDLDVSPFLGAQLFAAVRTHLATAQPPRRFWQHPVGVAAIVGVWTYGSLALLLFVHLAWWAALVSAVSLGLAIACGMLAVSHDAIHHGLTGMPMLDRAIVFSLGCFGATSAWWTAKHNVLHHGHTNEYGRDNDLDFAPFARFSPEQPWKPWHRYQATYLPFLLPFLTLAMVFGDLRFVLSGKVGTHVVENRTWRRRITLLAAKVAIPSVLLSVALTTHAWVAVVGYVLVAYLVSGAVLGILFSMNHSLDELSRPRFVAGREAWVFRQIEGSADIAPSNRLLTWYSGALNLHVEHHLFPRVASQRLPEVRLIVRRVCAEHGVAVHEQATVRAAVLSWRRYLRRMGQPPVTR